MMEGGSPFSEQNTASGSADRASDRRSRILGELNEVQLKAVEHKEGPMVVFAGAGSGKTRIITHRIAWLIESGIRPWEILAVTFTNKAAAEMRARVDDLTPFGKRVLISTFHSACARWLREFAPELGFTSNFTIYDDKDSLAALKAILKEMNVKLDDEITAADFKYAINQAKTMAMLPSDARLHGEYADLFPEAGVQVYRRYQEYLAASNAMDFGDLILNILLLLRRNATVKQVLPARYRYILVDEYQDTNRTQFELIRRLSEKHGNLCVVGDDDQSIYSWRGAIPANIIEFDKVYPGAVSITMEQNYRCSGHIVTAANAMIAHNRFRVAKTLFTENEPGDKISYRLEPDNDLESAYVIESLQEDMAKFSLSDIAVFYRTNAQSRLLEDHLMRANIPYQIFGTVRFYDRMEIKDLLAYFRVLTNPVDNISLKRIINVPSRGIGAKAVEAIEQESIKRRLSLWETIQELVIEDAPRLAAKLRPFVNLMDTLKAGLSKFATEDVLEFLLDEIDYLRFIDKKYPDQSIDKTENIHELGSAMAAFAHDNPDSSLTDWLQSVTLSSEESDQQGGVSLMTLHMAKGLEYDRVYIVGVEEGLLPHRNSMGDNEALEEERRLFYVGITRAKKKLSFASAYRRRMYNQFTGGKPSRFLSEIPHECYQVATEAEAEYLASMASGGSYYEVDPDLSDSGAQADTDHGIDYDQETEGPSLSSGDTVSHPTYGRGIVEEVGQEFGAIKAVVNFNEFGRRKVLVHHLLSNS